MHASFRLVVASPLLMFGCGEQTTPARAASEMITTADPIKPSRPPKGAGSGNLPITKTWLGPEMPSPTYESKTQHAGTCADLARLTPPKLATEVRPLALVKLRCLTRKTFDASQDSKTSNVRAFALDASALASLPSELATTVGISETANTTWKSARPNAAARVDGKVLVVDDGEATYSIAAMATGDVDGDGLEDLLLEVIGGTSRDSVFTARTFVVSRNSESAPLKVIKLLVP